MSYRQLLPWKEPTGGTSFRIISGDFVVVDPSADSGSGTGIVHIAPAFGEDDYRVAREAELGFLQLVDVRGAMTDDCPEGVAGLFLQGRRSGPSCAFSGRREASSRKSSTSTTTPFCWRASDDPLIQYARPAWFVGTSRFKEDLLRNSNAVKWVPDHIRTGRFGKFLENNVDWALSRERYWGTPLPIWRCEATGHLEAIASYEELLGKPDVQGTEVWESAKAESPELSNHLRVHRPYIDAVTYQSPKDSSARMRRVTEVIDCWYDSGAMPFAQWGYPHVPGSDKQFAEAFPADFISEAIDQTRGWFYSLLAESTLVHQGRDVPHPYKTCIVLGHIGDDEGRKMSKSLGNYVSPTEAIDAHGADALRWYFLSQGNPWTNARFSLTRVGEAKKGLSRSGFKTSTASLLIYANIDGFDPAAGLADAADVDGATLAGGDGYRPVQERGLMDRWVLSELQLATRAVDESLGSYDILGGSRALFDFVDRLSNWYVRRSRSRFWASGMTEDKHDAYWTLYECLVTVSRLSAPFVPFFSESTYQNLVARRWPGSQPESVHLCDFPSANEELIDEELSRRMRLTLDLVALGRAARVEAKLRVRQPLRELTVCVRGVDARRGTGRVASGHRGGAQCQENHLRRGRRSVRRVHLEAELSQDRPEARQARPEAQARPRRGRRGRAACPARRQGRV